MRETRVRVYFFDEVPRIGSGWRIVSVAIGRKWVRLNCYGVRAQLKKAAWSVIATSSLELPERPHKQKRAPRSQPPPLAIESQ